MQDMLKALNEAKLPLGSYIKSMTKQRYPGMRDQLGSIYDHELSAGYAQAIMMPVISDLLKERMLQADIDLNEQNGQKWFKEESLSTFVTLDAASMYAAMNAANPRSFGSEHDVFVRLLAENASKYSLESAAKELLSLQSTADIYVTDIEKVMTRQKLKDGEVNDEVNKLFQKVQKIVKIVGVEMAVMCSFAEGAVRKAEEELRKAMEDKARESDITDKHKTLQKVKRLSRHAAENRMTFVEKHREHILVPVPAPRTKFTHQAQGVTAVASIHKPPVPAPRTKFTHQAQGVTASALISSQSHSSSDQNPFVFTQKPMRPAPLPPQSPSIPSSSSASQLSGQVHQQDVGGVLSSVAQLKQMYENKKDGNQGQGGHGRGGR